MSGFVVDHMNSTHHFGYIIRADGSKLEYNHLLSECDYDNNCGIPIEDETANDSAN